MEKRMFGIVLTILGIAGLIGAGINFMSSHGGVYNIKLIAMLGILGVIFFFAGIGLLRNTKDRPT